MPPERRSFQPWADLPPLQRALPTSRQRRSDMIVLRSLAALPVVLAAFAIRLPLDDE